MSYCHQHRMEFSDGYRCPYCVSEKMVEQEGELIVASTWNTAYPERRPWSEIGEEAQAEWRRVFAIYDSLKP